MAFPWYFPIPLCPTPPNGRLSTDKRVIWGYCVTLTRANNCIISSYIGPPPQNSTVELWEIDPALMLPHTVSNVFFVLVNRYTTSGFSLGKESKVAC